MKDEPGSDLIGDPLILAHVLIVGVIGAAIGFRYGDIGGAILGPILGCLLFIGPILLLTELLITVLESIKRSGTGFTVVLYVLIIGALIYFWD